MMIHDLRVRARFADDFQSVIRVNFWYFKDGKRMVMRGDSFDSIDMDVYVANPEHGVIFDKTQAQALMDNLWECGIRPTEGSGSAGSLAATEKHLSDMQKVQEEYFKLVERLTNPILNPRSDITDRLMKLVEHASKEPPFIISGARE